MLASPPGSASWSCFFQDESFPCEDTPSTVYKSCWLCLFPQRGQRRTTPPACTYPSLRVFYGATAASFVKDETPHAICSPLIWQRNAVFHTTLRCRYLRHSAAAAVPFLRLHRLLGEAAACSRGADRSQSRSGGATASV